MIYLRLTYVCEIALSRISISLSIIRLICHISTSNAEKLSYSHTQTQTTRAPVHLITATHMTTRSHVAGAALILCTMQITASPTAHAQPYPTRPVRIVVGFTPSGGIDIAARVIAQKLGESFGQQVFVDNRPGASGIIASELVARSPPDGYMLSMVSVSHVANPGLFAKLPYDTVKDFAGVALVGIIPNVVVVHPSLPVHSLKALVDLAKRQPGQLSFSASGNGSSSDLAMQLLTRTTHINLLRVPYKGAATSFTALLSGEVALTSATLPAALPFITNQRVRVLAVSTLKRSPSIPSVPTVAESGYPGFNAVGFTGLVAPAATPRAIVTRINKDVSDAQRQGDLSKRFRELGFDPGGGTPEEFDNYIRTEILKWSQILKQEAIRVE